MDKDKYILIGGGLGGRREIKYFMNTSIGRRENVSTFS